MLRTRLCSIVLRLIPQLKVTFVYSRFNSKTLCANCATRNAKARADCNDTRQLNTKKRAKLLRTKKEEDKRAV